MAKAVLVIDMPERCTKCPLLLTIPQKGGLALCLARPTNGQEEYNPEERKNMETRLVSAQGTAGEIRSSRALRQWKIRCRLERMLR